MAGYIEANVAKGAKTCTDGRKSHSGLENRETVNHGGGEYVRAGDTSTVWSRSGP